ncbi:hypothetical protein PoB_004005700 [Plakobranchus ocellatus]|uniref:Uncharacterized protein n=1 Tax=Plakobranchus ocellatus TaxID=259542 RepID=A0AAV4B1Y3_9GAST|nr:hypothetical protein PoB_004005700 [Plakobranchus ocellatus]
MADRQHPRLKQTPKHLERMLFVNHKEEQNLKRRLEAIATSGRVRSNELDRERIKMRNVWRYNSRLSHTHIAPLLGQIPSLIKKEVQRPNDAIDPVNMHLLREYRKNCQIIPSILSALTKDSQQHDSDAQRDEPNKEDITEKRQRDQKQINTRRDMKQKFSRLSSVSGAMARRNRKRQISASGEESEGIAISNEEDDDVIDGSLSDQPDSSKVTQLVKDITKLRTEISANKKVDLKRAKVSFQDMLRGVHAQRRRDSESDTYTDGACALLRRKMHKLRNPDDSDSAVEVTLDAGKGEFKIKHLLPRINQKRHSLPQSVLQTKKKALPATRSFSSVPTISRQQALLGESEETMKKQLEAQERYHTEVKVAKEIEKFRCIQSKISDFLEKHKRKHMPPLLYEQA